MRQPKVGEIVLFRCDASSFKAENNTGNIAPAIVVRVWSPTCVNLKVMLDGSNPDLWMRSSVMLEEGDAPTEYGSWRYADTVAI